MTILPCGVAHGLLFTLGERMEYKLALLQSTATCVADLQCKTQAWSASASASASRLTTSMPGSLVHRLHKLLTFTTTACYDSLESFDHSNRAHLFLWLMSPGGTGTGWGVYGYTVNVAPPTRGRPRGHTHTYTWAIMARKKKKRKTTTKQELEAHLSKWLESLPEPQSTVRETTQDITTSTRTLDESLQLKTRTEPQAPAEPKPSDPSSSRGKDLHTSGSLEPGKVGSPSKGTDQSKQSDPSSSRGKDLHTSGSLEPGKVGSPSKGTDQSKQSKTKSVEMKSSSSGGKERPLPASKYPHRLQGLSPHSFVRSRANDIPSPPWVSGEEFTAVYTWLYSYKTELMSKGVARVAAWSTRCKLPVGIDLTAHLCEAILMEMKYNAGNSYQALSFGYSVAITR